MYLDLRGRAIEGDVSFSARASSSCSTRRFRLTTSSDELQRRSERDDGEMERGLLLNIALLPSYSIECTCNIVVPAPVTRRPRLGDETLNLCEDDVSKVQLTSIHAAYLLLVAYITSSPRRHFKDRTRYRVVSEVSDWSPCSQGKGADGGEVFGS